MLIFVSDSYKNQNMCNNAVDNYAHALGFVPVCFKTQKMFDKAASTILLFLFLIDIRHKKCVIKLSMLVHLYLRLFLISTRPKKCAIKLFMKNLLCFMLRYCHDKYKAQEMYDNAVDDFLLALIFVPDCLVTSKMIEKLDDSVLSNNHIVFGDLDSKFVTFFSNDIGLSI